MTLAGQLRTDSTRTPLPQRRALPAPSRRYLKISNVFTGIVQGIGKVQRVDRKTEFCSYSIDFPSGKLAEVQTGGSIAINGTCLTVVGSQGDTAQFDVIGESLKRTNLGLLQEGSKVNFERAARIGDEIGGHNVSGHVHTTATITSVTETENNRRLEFQASSFSNQVHA